MALLRGSGVDDDQALLGAHHAAALGHSDCCLQVVPWRAWGKVRVQLLARGHPHSRMGTLRLDRFSMFVNLSFLVIAFVIPPISRRWKLDLGEATQQVSRGGGAQAVPHHPWALWKSLYSLCASPSSSVRWGDNDQVGGTP